MKVLEKIKISVIVTSYNYEQFIRTTIESVINQTYENWELIIVDDGSEDNSVEIIEKYCENDNRIKLFKHPNGTHKGLKDSFLLGIEKASCEWLSFLESDDYYKPNYLEEKVKKIYQYSDAGLIFNDVELFGDDDEIKGFSNYLLKRQNILKNTKIQYKDLLSVNLIPTFSCVMVKKNILKTCNMNSPLPQSLDYFLWIQLYTKLQIIYLPQKLSWWRKHSKNYMKTACFSKQASFDLEILKILAGKNPNKLLLLIYGFIRNRQLEKLFRPQVNFLSNMIAQPLLIDKSLELIQD